MSNSLKARLMALEALKSHKLDERPTLLIVRGMTPCGLFYITNFGEHVPIDENSKHNRLIIWSQANRD